MKIDKEHLHTASSTPAPRAKPRSLERPRSWLLWPLAGIAVLIALAAASEDARNYFYRMLKERELANAAQRIVAGIESYYQQSPGTVKQFPLRLNDVLLDPRFLAEKRHLDALPADPLTNQIQWGEIKDAQGAVIGVHSLSQGNPTIARIWFAPAGSSAEKYSDWRFVYRP